MRALYKKTLAVTKSYHMQRRLHSPSATPPCVRACVAHLFKGDQCEANDENNILKLLLLIILQFDNNIAAIIINITMNI